MSWSSTTIADVRNLVDDTATSNLNRGETPTGTRNSTNKMFQLYRFPIVSGSVYLTTGTTQRTQAGFTVDTTNGYITFTSAPTGTEDPWFVDYNWQWFSDTEYNGFLDSASRDLGFSPTATIPDGLTNALLYYAASNCFQSMSAKYASKFNSSGGGQGVSVDVVTGNYLKLANEKRKKADDMKNAYYMRHGQRNAPAAAIESANLDPWTPMR